MYNEIPETFIGVNRRWDSVGRGSLTDSREPTDATARIVAEGRKADGSDLAVVYIPVPGFTNQEVSTFTRMQAKHLIACSVDLDAIASCGYNQLSLGAYGFINV
jgi:hypothetical protein